MSSGFTPPPWHPPDAPSNQLNPLAILNLLQEKKKMEMEQQRYQDEQASHAEDQILKGVQAGIPLKDLVNAHPEFPANKIGMFQNIEKQIKSQAADEAALKQLPAFQSAAGNTVGPKGEIVPPTDVGSAQSIYGSLSPDTQTIFNQAVSARNAEMQQKAAEVQRAKEEAALASRRSLSNTLTVQAQGSRLGEQVANRKEAVDAAAGVLASGTQDQQAALRPQLEKIFGAAEATRVLDRAAVKGANDAATLSAKILQGPAGAQHEIALAVAQNMPGLTPSQAVLVASKHGSYVPMAPGPDKFLPFPPESDEVKGQIHGSLISKTLDRMDENIRDISQNPVAIPQARGLGAIGLANDAYRLLGTQSGPVASFDANVKALSFGIPRLLGVPRTTQIEIQIARSMAPLQTEIIGADGKVTQGTIARLKTLHQMVDAYRAAPFDPTGEAQLKLDRQAEAATADMSPQEKEAGVRFYDAMRMAEGPARDAAMAKAALDMQKFGANRPTTKVDSFLDKHLGPGAQ